MSFQEYLKSDERKSHFVRATPTNNQPRLGERLQFVHHSDVHNWAHKYNGGIIPENLALKNAPSASD